jgi:hypothetical protein
MGLVEAMDIADIVNILQIYCRYIADRLPQIAVDCGGKRRIMVEGVMGVFHDSTPLLNSSFCKIRSW